MSDPMDAPSKYTFVVATQDNPKSVDLVSQVNAHVAAYTHTRRHLRASKHNFIQSNLGQEAVPRSAKKQTSSEPQNTAESDDTAVKRAPFRFTEGRPYRKARAAPRKLVQTEKAQARSLHKRPFEQAQDAFTSFFPSPSPTSSDRDEETSDSLTWSTRTQYRSRLRALYRDVELPASMERGDSSDSETTLQLFDNDPLSAALDPFIRLPVEVNEREKSLLHFFLKEGRLHVLGSSQNEKYCISLQISSKWLQESAIFVLNHVVMAEAQLSNVTGKPLSRGFYQRRSQVYAEVRQLVSRPEVSFSLKLIAVIQLVFMEWTMKLPELQTLHAQAVDALIESQGGLMSFLPALESGHGPTIEPHFYTNIFVITEVPIRDQNSLNLLKNRFITTLKHLVKWEQYFQTQLDQQEPYPNEHLQSLTAFLQAPINETLLSTTQPWPFVAAPFFCCLNICLTFLEYDMKPASVNEFLQRLQHDVFMTAVPSARGGAAIAHLLARVRMEMLCPASYTPSQEIKHAEIRINQASTDALKIYSLLSGGTRLKLTQWLCGLCLQLVARIDPKYTVDGAALETIRMEITFEWLSRQLRRRAQSSSSAPGD